MKESLSREAAEWADEPEPLDTVAELIPEAATWRPLGELLPLEEYGPPLAGSVHAQWVTCGKPGCKCARGELHGPYWYRFAREGGRLRKHYIPREELDAVRVRCEERRMVRRAVHEARRRMALKVAASKAYMRPLKDILNRLMRQEAARERRGLRNGRR